MGADDNILSNSFLPLGKVRIGYPTGENERGLKMDTIVISLGVDYGYSDSHTSPHLTSPEREGQIPLTGRGTGYT